MRRALGFLPILSERSVARRLTIAILLLVGVWLRLQHLDEHGSDVLTVTREAIRHVATGENPYGHGYVDSIPPGAPYAYGPLALVYYALMPGQIELYASIAVLVVLALGNRIMGLAWLAFWAPLWVLANDGSNDTSVGLLLLGALALLGRWPAGAAVALAAVVAVKPYALAFLPPLLAFGGWTLLVPFALASLAAWGPALVLWGPGSILWSLQAATNVHEEPWYSLGALLNAYPYRRPLLAMIQLACGGTAALLSLRFARTPRAVVGWGSLIFAGTLFTGWWATVAYWAAVVPALAWHLDGWFRDAASRVSRPAAARAVDVPRPRPAE